MKAPANFGRLARAYRWMEYFSFGPYLQQCRRLRLAEMASSRRALIYGDGDGRFLATLMEDRPTIHVVAVDASNEMLQQAARRLPSGVNVRLVHADALECDLAEFPEAPFDLVVTHFFLDCFHEGELTPWLSQVNAAVAENALWVLSEFAIPKRNPARLAGMLIVRGLYLIFGLLTGLRTRRLPEHERIMQSAGWVLEDRRELLLGILVSETWRRSAPC
jgi:cyclopropane fatty-acyl-phospholipid synthase-like methyltransferase